MEMELGESSHSPNSSQMDSQEKINTSQTDESKVAEQQTRTQQSSKPRVPCVSDTGNNNILLNILFLYRYYCK
jgi:baculoviral IAP repeat-containing protein 6